MLMRHKYRAWDTRINKMFPYVVLGWNGSIEGYAKEDTEHRNVRDLRMGLNDEFEDYDGEIVVMEGTGLLDKNGVEIFTDDVVEFLNMRSFGRGGDNEKEQVHFSKEGLMYKCGIWTLEYVNSERELEVIGDIHSNPELLK